MKIQTTEGVVFIADDSPAAVSIRAGSDFSVRDGRLSTSSQSGLTNYWQVSLAIEKAKTVDDIKDILAAMVKIAMI